MHLVTITLNIKAKMKKIKCFQLKNILIRLGHMSNMVNDLIKTRKMANSVINSN